MSTTYEDLLTWIEGDPRVYVESRSSEVSAWVDFQVDHPGYGRDQFWVLWEVGPDGVDVTVLFDWAPRGSADRDWRQDSAYRLGLDDFKAYVESLPRPFTAFGAVEIEEVEA